jgi:hypothetical protein
VNYASELLSASQIYFASDSSLAIDEAEQYAQGNNVSVVQNSNQIEPLHLDFASRETIHSTRWPTNKLHLQIFG